MSFDFGSLSAKADEPYRVNLLDPLTDTPLVGTDGQPAYIDVLSAQSEIGRTFDRERSRAVIHKAARGGSVLDDDPLEQNIAKLSRLTVGWNLVDPTTKQPLGVPFSAEAAQAFYALPLAESFYRQTWVAAHEVGNFLQKGSSDSSKRPSTTSKTPAP